ncbi:hypothetical protein ACRV3R_000231 [Citrobacter freundii]
MKVADAIRQEESVVSEEVQSLSKAILSWARSRKILISPVQALKLARGGEVWVLDNTFRANPVTGELIVTGTDIHWRKMLAHHKAEALLHRWKLATR